MNPSKIVGKATPETNNDTNNPTSTYRFHKSCNFRFLEICANFLQPNLEFLECDLTTIICVDHLEHLFQACDFLF